MQLRNILIVHGSRSVRRLLKTYIVSELDDAVIFEVETAAEALEKLQDKKFEVILCGKVANEIGQTFLHKKMEEISLNKETPVIILTSTCTVENIDEFVKEGIKHYMVIPFTHFDLRVKINEVCDPRNWRVHDRVSIPDTKATIHLKDCDVEADVINLSETGLLCDIASTTRFNDLVDSSHITVKFPAKHKGAEIKILWCKLFRVIVLDWDEEYFPKCAPQHMRVVWQIVKMSDEDKTKLAEVSKSFNEESTKDAKWLNQDEVDKFMDQNK